MKYTAFFILVGCFLIACGQKQEANLQGNWKTYKVNYNGKDISKSSDPKNSNGFWFDGKKNYRRFGIETHRDTGTYQVKGNLLSFKSQSDAQTITGSMTLKNDTLALIFPLQGKDTLKMSLYKMSK